VGVDAVAGTRMAYISGTGGTSPGLRAIETNYTLGTSRYDSLTLTYVAIDDGPDDELEEGLRAQYQASDGSWVTIDEITPADYNGRYFHRRATIDGVANASHGDFKVRFAQGETSGTDAWRLDTVGLVGVNESVETDLNQAPQAHFRYSPDSPTTGETITFDASRSDDPDDSAIANYTWDFGDGVTDTGKTVQHSYSSDGTYTVELTVTDERGKSVTKAQTVSVGGSGGGDTNAYITAIEPDPGNDKPPNDADIEFVRFELPASPDTSTWEIVDADANTQPFPSDLSGTVYFAGDPTEFANQWNGVSGSNVYDLGDVTLNNGGDNIILRDGSGVSRDEFAWGGQTTSSGWSFGFSTDGQVANRSYSGGSYEDTDSAADFSEEAECDFFGGGNGCGSPPGVESISVEDAPVNYSDAAGTENVTVVYNQTMDQTVTPTVTVTNDNGATVDATPDDGWLNDTAYRERIDIQRNSDDLTATVEVSDAENTAGTVQSPNPATDTFRIDTEQPGEMQAIRTPIIASAANASALDVAVQNPGTLYGDETIRVTFTGPNGNAVTAETLPDGAGGDDTTVTMNVSSLAEGSSENGDSFDVTTVAFDEVQNSGASASVQGTIIKDTVAPSVDSYDVSRFDSDEFTVTVEATDVTTGVEDLSLSFSGPGSIVERTSTNNVTNGDTTTFSLRYRVDQPGEYTVTLDSLVDGVGNDGASGQSGSVVVGTTAENIEYNNDGATFGGNSVRFSLTNTVGDTYTIQNFTVVNTSANNAETVGNGSRSGGSGYTDEGPELRDNKTGALLDVSSPFSVGSTQPATGQVTSEETTEYVLAEFRQSNNQERDPGSPVYISIGFSDGSIKTIRLDL
jgi:PKD repeat protein